MPKLQPRLKSIVLGSWTEESRVTLADQTVRSWDWSPSGERMLRRFPAAVPSFPSLRASGDTVIDEAGVSVR